LKGEVTCVSAAAFMVVVLAGWVNSSNPALEAKASTPIATTRFDAFEMMCTAKNLPDQEFEDFSLVFFVANSWRVITHTLKVMSAWMPASRRAERIGTKLGERMVI
jgi:hypothetical protein